MPPELEPGASGEFGAFEPLEPRLVVSRSEAVPDELLPLVLESSFFFLFLFLLSLEFIEVEVVDEASLVVLPLAELPLEPLG